MSNEFQQYDSLESAAASRTVPTHSSVEYLVYDESDLYTIFTNVSNESGIVSLELKGPQNITASTTLAHSSSPLPKIKNVFILNPTAENSENGMNMRDGVRADLIQSSLAQSSSPPPRIKRVFSLDSTAENFENIWKQWTQFQNEAENILDVIITPNFNQNSYIGNSLFSLETNFTSTTNIVGTPPPLGRSEHKKMTQTYEDLVDPTEDMVASTGIPDLLNSSESHFDRMTNPASSSLVTNTNDNISDGTMTCSTTTQMPKRSKHFKKHQMKPYGPLGQRGEPKRRYMRVSSNETEEKSTSH